MAGSRVTFASNSESCEGYLAIPESDRGPGVIVLQEWWGLVDHITDVCDRFAAEGYVALAPDLYHGDMTKSPDEAGKLMMALNIDKTEKDMAGAIDYLISREDCTSSTVGTVGFCMGGQLSLYAATKNPKVSACVVYYGIHPDVKPDLENLHAPVLGFFAEKDSMVTPEVARQLEADIKAAGKDVEIHIYEGADHAFFNDTREEGYNAEYAAETWDRMLKFYAANIR